MDDIRAVMDAAGSIARSLLRLSEGVPLSILFAATYPERTQGLMLYGGSATYVTQSDYPWQKTLAEWQRVIAEHAKATLSETWGTIESARAWLRHFAPSAVNDDAQVEWFAEFARLSASPGAVIALDRMNLEVDVRSHFVCRPCADTGLPSDRRPRRRHRRGALHRRAHPRRSLRGAAWQRPPSWSATRTPTSVRSNGFYPGWTTLRLLRQPPSQPRTVVYLAVATAIAAHCSTTQPARSSASGATGGLRRGHRPRSFRRSRAGGAVRSRGPGAGSPTWPDDPGRRADGEWAPWRGRPRPVLPLDRDPTSKAGVNPRTAGYRHRSDLIAAPASVSTQHPRHRSRPCRARPRCSSLIARA